MVMARFISNKTPRNAAGVYDSGPISVGSSDSLTGGVFSDVAGTLYIEQSLDGGTNWDISKSQAIVANTGYAIDEKILTPTARIRFVVGVSNQAVFRLAVRASTAGPR